MKITYPFFKGFYLEERYLDIFDKCLNNYEEIISQVLLEIRDRIAPKSPEQDDIIEIDDEEKQPKKLFLDSRW